MADDTIIQGVLGSLESVCVCEKPIWISLKVGELDDQGDDDLLNFLHFDLNGSVLIKMSKIWALK